MLGYIDFRNHVWLSGSQTVRYKIAYGDCDAGELKFSAEFCVVHILYEVRSYWEAVAHVVKKFCVCCGA
jgi:hypothetical protein